MDPSGFFEEPVTEELAPGYSKVVSHPMCFQASITPCCTPPQTYAREWWCRAVPNADQLCYSARVLCLPSPLVVCSGCRCLLWAMLPP